MYVRARCAVVLPAVAASLVLFMSGPAGAAGSHWTIEPTTVPHAASGSLSAVSCLPAADGQSCVAVGSFVAPDGNNRSLTLSGDGSGWQPIGSPHAAGVDDSSLTGVSCVQVELCFAVGQQSRSDAAGEQSLAARWNGTTWQVLPTPNPRTGAGGEVLLAGISCASASRCVAVGQYFDARTIPITPILLAWDGSTWSQLDAGLPAGASRAWLSGIDCMTEQICLAVGTQTTGDAHATLVAQIDGSSVTYGDAVSPQHGAAFRAVSCTAATACTAVGESEDAHFADGTLVETWDGTTWSVVASPNAKGLENDLDSVSCTSSTSCLAVGQTTPYNKGRTLAEHWNGTTWRLSPAPNGAGDGYTSFAGVSCVSRSDCVAVGERYMYTEPGQSFTARWHDGQWMVLSGGSVGGLEPSDFAAVSCPTELSCVGVGAAVTISKHDRIFAERRSSNGWTVADLPQLSGVSDAALRGISCPYAGECMAVGWTSNRRYGGSRGDRSLALRLHDGAWGQLTTANPRGGDQLAAVSCPTLTFCVAVGRSNQPAAQLFDGTSWRSAQLPSLPNSEDPGQLNGVSCPSVDFCLAVGSYLDTDTFETIPVAYQWNGTSWSDASTDLTSEALAVSCTSSTFCMAVGDRDGSPLTESWDGTHWTRLSAYSGHGALLAVSCRSAQNCVAVGQRYPGAPAELIEQWTGTKWVLRTDVQQTGSPAAVLNGVSCASDTVCVAAGDRGNFAQAPLVESATG